MNANQIEGSWKQLKGTVQQQWGRLTDSDIDRIAGKRDELVGTLQKRYGDTREAIEEQVREFFDKLAG